MKSQIKVREIWYAVEGIMGHHFSKPDWEDGIFQGSESRRKLCASLGQGSFRNQEKPVQKPQAWTIFTMIKKLQEDNFIQHTLKIGTNTKTVL